MFIFHSDIHFSLRTSDILLNAVQVSLVKKIRCLLFNSVYIFDSNVHSLFHDFYGLLFLSTSYTVRKKVKYSEELSGN